MGKWAVIATEEYKAWYQGLTGPQRAAVAARIDLLSEKGPALGRPTVDTLEATNIPNLKEVRISKGGDLRVLFAFDPLQQAVLLVGGNKAGAYKKWYVENIAVAEKLYKAWIAQLRKEGKIA